MHEVYTTITAKHLSPSLMRFTWTRLNQVNEGTYSVVKCVSYQVLNTSTKALQYNNTPYLPPICLLE